jgi:ferredoxin
MKTSDMELNEDFDDDWQEPIEESEIQPDELYSNTCVACPRCARVSPYKRHLPKGKYNAYCASCRRVKTNRESAARGRIRAREAAGEAAAAAHRAFVAALRHVNSCINRFEAQSKHQAAAMELKVEYGTATPRTLRALARRKAMIGYYEAVRNTMTADLARNALKPMEHYLQDEKLYAAYKHNTSPDKLAAAESGAVQLDEPEGMGASPQVCGDDSE